MSSSWSAEYLTALEARDAREKSQYELYTSYTKLADRTASLTELSPPLETASGNTGDKPKRPMTPTEKTPATMTTVPAAAATTRRLRQDLAEAQRTKAELETRLKAHVEEVEKLKKTLQGSAKRVQGLSAERALLATRVSDRDEELRGKAKLLENVQDELISLNLQLNVAEKRAQDLQTENRELIDRWMARMGREADAMNDASKFS